MAPRPLDRLTRAAAVLAVAVLAAACSGGPGNGDGDGDRVRVVASIYPLAWLSEQISGDRVEVTDLTPPGVEAHDVALTASQRTDLQTADVVVILDVPGFQPDVDTSVEEAQGDVLRVPPTSSLPLEDPHVWLDPALLSASVGPLADALVAVDPGGERDLRRRADVTGAALDELWLAFEDGLRDCRYRSFVTTHEAFGYFAAAFRLRQVGLEGLSPESEPTAERIQAAAEDIESGEAAPAIFFEDTDAGRRIGESVAADLGVPALALSTLESAPASGDYLSVMRENLARLREGLQCR